MAGRKVLLLVSCLVVLAQMASTNIVLECISLFYCNGNVPVCGSNGTHCWHSKSDCERAKFNCLQLYKKDFDKVDLGYCIEFTLGGIKECCVRKTCPNTIEQICGQAISKTLSKCRWFKNRCELQNYNCGNEKDAFIETDKAFCNFEFGGNEQHCTKENLKNDTLSS